MKASDWGCRKNKLPGAGKNETAVEEKNKSLGCTVSVFYRNVSCCLPVRFGLLPTNLDQPGELYHELDQGVIGRTVVL